MSRYLHPPPIVDESSIAYPDQLAISLDRLVTQYPPSSLAPSGGLYSGLLSVTYLFWSLNKRISEGITIQGHSLRQLHKAYWSQAKRYERALLGDTGIDGIKVRPWRCGVGEDTVVYAAMKVIVSLENKDADAETQVEAFCLAVRQVSGKASTDQERRHGKPASNEWLYGRAGTLYLLRAIRHAMPANNSRPNSLVDTIDNTMRALVDEIVYAPRPWIWHGKPYLGAVHGSAGIIAQVLSTMETIEAGRDEELLDAMKVDVEQLLDLQLLSGNWPSSIPHSPSGSHHTTSQDRLLQFCHGSPGVIACLDTIARLYPSLAPRISTSINRAQQDILTRGWLTKEPCLCHGTTGNALSLADRRARNSFLMATTEHQVQRLQSEGIVSESDAGEGLYTGVAGRAWVWALLATGEDHAGPGLFLGFNDV